MKEFEVNEYITLKLEGGKTNIYVSGQLFNQCKFLLLNIPIEKISSFDEILSIDEAAENLDRSLEESQSRVSEIPPEVEFWGHCSNLQVWWENNYDTRLLHSNLAFNFLKKLTDVEDPLAKQVFKEEIIKRLKTGYPPIVNYLFEAGFSKYLNEDELRSVLNPIEVVALEEIEAYTGVEYHHNLINNISILD